MIVHQSSLKCWRRCRRQYYYRYIRRLQRRKPPVPLLRGRVVHEMLENEANGKDPWAPLAVMSKEYAELLREEREEYGDLPTEITRLMKGYFTWYKKDPLKAVALKGKKAEHEFEVDLTPSIKLRGKIDRVGKDRRGDIWLVDHKTHKQLPKGDLKYSDIQSVVYAWAMPQMGFPTPRGVCWDYIKWKPPSIPELLKDGTMSRRSNIDTTWGVYKEALIEAGLKPKDYADMEEKLQGKENDFYVRSYLPLNKTITETLIDEARVTAREIKRKAGVNNTRTIDRHCEWCEFYNLCQAELRGLDHKFIEKHDYKEKTDENEEQVEEAIESA